MLEALVECCPLERPILLPLSRSSPQGERERSEVAAGDALAWTQVGGGALPSLARAAVNS